MDNIAHKRIAAEKRNTMQLVRALLAAGHRIAVDYMEGDKPEPTNKPNAIRDALHACDEERLLIYRAGEAKPFAWIYLVYGNADDGSEVVADMTVNLSELLDPIMEGWDA